jgi:hypothetical protein
MLRMIPNLRRASMAAGGVALSAYAIGAAVAETPIAANQDAGPGGQLKAAPCGGEGPDALRP